jgi:hypothetical protein
MTRKRYEKPVVQVVRLQHYGHLLQSSANVKNYDIEDEQEWP